MAATPDATVTPVHTAAWVTDRAWLSGLAGALAVLGCAFWYRATDALSQGVWLLGWQVAEQRIDTLLLALVLITLVMLTVEAVRLRRWQGDAFWALAPLLRERRYGRFALDCVQHYVKNLLLLSLAMAFFRSAGEYGYQAGAPYYQAWFRLLTLLWWGYLLFGWVYVLVTRALKHDLAADQRDLTTLLDWRQRHTESYRKNARALLVKLFFAPLMTVFFVEQFPHLINNLGYLANGLPEQIQAGRYTHRQANQDLFNITIAVIFSIDVALAWCGYLVSSRWVDNQTRSAEPTLLGWLVCLICYPPFQQFLGLYYAAPGEREVLYLSVPWLATLATVLMLLSYVVYMLATLWFGVRFSNLTHRGILRTGPYALIRHPAYAAKNLAWWCVMFPVILANVSATGWLLAATQIAGLCLMTGVYYARALTEERHLRADPDYVAYCQQVRYRFIPGLI